MLIVEMIVPAAGVPDLSKWLDLEMLVMSGGMERTQEEYEQILNRAGFKLERVVSTHSPAKIIEGRPG